MQPSLTKFTTRIVILLPSSFLNVTSCCPQLGSSASTLVFADSVSDIVFFWVCVCVCVCKCGKWRKKKLDKLRLCSRGDGVRFFDAESEFCVFVCLKFFVFGVNRLKKTIDKFSVFVAHQVEFVQSDNIVLQIFRSQASAPVLRQRFFVISNI